MSGIKQEPKKKGLVLARHFTVDGKHPFDTVEWATRDAVIVGMDGKEKFRQNGVEVPASWPENSINVVAEKYFRMVGGKKESSAKQMFHRVAWWITLQTINQSILEGTALTATMPEPGHPSFDGQAKIFYDELLYMLANGFFAYNSPVWFNVGTDAFGTGYVYTPMKAVPLQDGGARKTLPDEHRPQCSACFIQSVEDNMDSIMDVAKREVMLFKGGSGTGSNLSPLRSSYEILSSGGKPSGPVSFMEGFDAFAGVTKSGGGTRRAAKLVALNADHPDILIQRNGKPGFITCKAVAEDLAHDIYSTGKYTAEWNVAGNVYDLVDFQNANNSVRASDEFMEAVEGDKDWVTKKVSNGKIVHTYKARMLWDEIAKAAHKCGDPGLQFDTTINGWHTCKTFGRINASNPCSEYMFLDDTACNLASLNLRKFSKKGTLDVQSFKQGCKIGIIGMEALVDASSYPSGKIAEMSHMFRTLGLGYLNLGGLLMEWGLPYNSNEGRAVAAGITAIMGAVAQQTSAQLAKVQGPFPEYEKNKKSVAEVMDKHLDAAKLIPRLTGTPWNNLAKVAVTEWQEAVELGELYGYRNAQVTVLAPTGTISFLMDADTTGVEPQLGEVVFKKAVGEGLMKMPNRVVKPALQNLGYSGAQIEEILQHIVEKGTIHTAPSFNDKKHGNVFSTALGDYALPPEAHVDMMIAVQPFISGSISKTVNMPKECTVEDIKNIYMRSWKGGLKSIAVYRDGCKLSQPVATSLTDTKLRQKSLEWGKRKPLPDTRESITHKFTIGGQHDGYFTIGKYPDGTAGEIFITMSKEGSTVAGFMASFSLAISLGLQHGTPLETYCDKFIGMRFDPAGLTNNEDIRIAKSIVDYIFRWLKGYFLEPKPEVILVPSPGFEEWQKQVEAAVKPVKTNMEGPPCSDCGWITERSGSCYRCPNCGTTTGCS